MLKGARTGGLVLLTLTAIARWVRASPDAEELFRDGRALMKGGRTAEACAQFQRSQRLEPKVGTLLNLADCRERMGQIATAWETFLEAKALAARVGDGRREGEAARRAADLEPRLSYLALVVPRDRRVPGLVVRRNGVDVDAARWDASLPLDPGDYTIEGFAPGHRVSAVSVHLDPGERRQVELDLAVDAARLPPTPMRAFGAGALLGANSRETPLVGVRVLAGLPLPGGALRGNGTILYSRHQDEASLPLSRTTTFSIGLDAEYVWNPLPPLAFAAGLGMGLEIDSQNLGRGTDVGGFWVLHASPVIVRLARGAVELGMHLRVMRAGDELTTVLLAGADVFAR